MGGLQQLPGHGMDEKILLVDDEPNILQSIQRQLRKRFTVVTATGGEEALRLLKEQGPFAVIVSDMRMPGMTGVELLAKVKEMYPEMTRLMLTGNADQETAMAAVNSGQIFRFLTKPCPPALFIPSLALALRQNRLVRAEKEVLQETLKKSLTVMSELLGIANPFAFSSGRRIQGFVVNLANALQLENVWEFEIAALLSQIGCVTLPSEILTKVYQGAELTYDEKMMYRNHPKVGATFLEKIPRLENVTKMIEMQQLGYVQYTDEMKEANFEDVILGAQLLKVAVDLDRLLYKGERKNEAVGRMRKLKDRYNPAILRVLPAVEYNEEQQVLTVTVEHVTLGMIAVEDVMTRNGVLVIPKGQEITRQLKEGLVNFNRQVGIVEPISVRLATDSDQDVESEDAA